MTPQESELVNDLFDRLEKLENAPREPDADRVIAAGARRAPHGLYALVQTVLVQDEALKRANARIEELQARLDGAQEPEQRASSFLASMRQALGGQVGRGGSVPSVRGGAAPAASPPTAPPQPGFTPVPPPGYGATPFGGGGSFLGTAACAAAGVIGGALLLDGIRSMFGHRTGAASGTLGDFSGERAAPWSGSNSDSDLARQSGIDHVGDHVRDDDDRASNANDQSSDADDDMQDDADDSFQTADDDGAVADDDFSDGGGDDFSDA
jgi:uncharacterized protein